MQGKCMCSWETWIRLNICRYSLQSPWIFKIICEHGPDFLSYKITNMRLPKRNIYSQKHSNIRIRSLSVIIIWVKLWQKEIYQHIMCAKSEGSSVTDCPDVHSALGPFIWPTRITANSIRKDLGAWRRPDVVHDAPKTPCRWEPWLLKKL